LIYIICQLVELLLIINQRPDPMIVFGVA
jgi:hypothetical protein